MYNGSLIRKPKSFAMKNYSGVYCIRPKIMKECGLDTQFKVGFTGGGTESRSLLKRMGTYATSFINFEIIFWCAYSRTDPESQHVLASMAESEVFAYLESAGSSRKIHRSLKRESEWFVDLDIDTVRGVFNHMLDVGQPAVRKTKGVHWKPMPAEAYWFGDAEFDMAEDGSVPMSTEAIIPLTNENDRVRRTLVRKLKDAKERGDQKSIDNFEAQLDTLLQGVRVDIEELQLNIRKPSDQTTLQPEDTKKDEVTEPEAQNIDVVDVSDSEGPDVDFEDFEPNEPTIFEEAVVNLFSSSDKTTTKEKSASETFKAPKRKRYNTRSQARGMTLRSRKLPGAQGLKVISMFM